MSEFHVHQSLPICIALASLGGMFEVAATAATALPSVREQQGYLVSSQQRWMAVIWNVILQMMGGLFSALLATWFGPVSIVVPFYYCATLLTNMVVFGVLLGVETFEKPMRVGTHVIVLAVILLPVVGPTISPDQTFDDLVEHWYANLWFLVLFVTTLWTGGILIFHASPTNTDPETNRFLKDYTPTQRTVLLLLCRAATMSVDLTVSRCLVLNPPKMAMAALIGTKIWSGNICTYAIVVQSYSVEQNKYVPLNATMVILVNALTGLLVWEDQAKSWYGYFCVFWLLGIGCDLLLTPELLTPENLEFGTNKSANILIAEGRRKFSTADTEEIKKLILQEHTSDLEGLLNAETPKRKGYQSINHPQAPPPPSIGNNEGSLFETPPSQRKHPMEEDGGLTISYPNRLIHPYDDHHETDNDDHLAWEKHHNTTTTTTTRHPMSPPTPASADLSSLLWNMSSSPQGSHASSTISSREAWSEVVVSQKRRRTSRTQWGGAAAAGNNHHSPQDHHAYFATQVVRQPRIPSPIPPSSRVSSANHQYHTATIPSIPTIPSGHQLVLDNDDDEYDHQLVLEAPSSLTSNEREDSGHRAGMANGPNDDDKTPLPSAQLFGGGTSSSFRSPNKEGNNNGSVKDGGQNNNNSVSDDDGSTSTSYSTKSLEEKRRRKRELEAKRLSMSSPSADSWTSGGTASC